MHLACLNIPQHLLQIWRNSVKPRLPNNCPFIVLQSDEAWAAHGALVASARPYLPSSFNRPPRNPAEKVNSGYKAWEFTIYFYVLGPAVFRLVLPDYLWTHFCQLVCGIRIVFQRRITREQVNIAHRMLVKWSKEFEEYYYQRNEALLYLVRPSTHAVLHLALETVRCGPLNLVAQWALENTVGNLGREVHQHSNPFANLSQRGLLRAQTNALVSMIPGLSNDKPLPPTSCSLGDGFVLLHAREKTYHGSVTPMERLVILRYLSKHRLLTSESAPRYEVIIRKWARLRLPNGQEARCTWKEEAKQRKQDFRNSRNIKFIDETSKKTYYAEVLYYFQVLVNDVEIPVAMTRPYTNPDPRLLQKSHGTLYVCQLRENVLNVINVKTIQSVVAMIPFPLRREEAVEESYQNFFYVGEKPFFELTIEGNDGNDSDDEDTD
ncbi:hypothetical protein F5887DRAFT_890610 [Amanita rubescens]|nr:hypothetical protein F5887DRAFT_890610 [Amanita rubescens]